MELHPDFRDLLAEFVRSGVRCVGGIDTEQAIARAEKLALK
jgi:hypothetical protein